MARSFVPVKVRGFSSALCVAALAVMWLTQNSVGIIVSWLMVICAMVLLFVAKVQQERRDRLNHSHHQH